VTAKALLFDFGGTLDAEGVPWKERFASAWRAEVGDVSPARFDPAFYAADDALVGAVPRDLSLEETVRRLAANLSRELDADPEAGARAGARFLREAAPRLEASAGLLRRLAERHRIGIVSNFYGNLDAVCAGTGLAPHLSVVVDSVVAGFEKPDPRIFRAALDALGASPEEAVFVGDSMPRDMEGARRLGMVHVWLAPGRDRGCCPGDAVIERLERLTEVIS
jgi:HAD superfamily hydrolase (TIGR01509 family)